MANLVLKVQENENPQESDILVFNKEKQCWITIPKCVFLHELTKDVELLKKQVEKANQNISALAEILKGELE